MEKHTHSARKLVSKAIQMTKLNSGEADLWWSPNQYDCTKFQ